MLRIFNETHRFALEIGTHKYGVRSDLQHRSYQDDEPWYAYTFCCWTPNRTHRVTVSQDTLSRHLETIVWVVWFAVAILRGIARG